MLEETCCIFARKTSLSYWNFCCCTSVFICFVLIIASQWVEIIYEVAFIFLFSNIFTRRFRKKTYLYVCRIDAVGSSGISKGKQKLRVTFNFDKQDVIDLTKIQKWQCAGPQKQIDKSSCRSFVFWAKKLYRAACLLVS